MSRQSDSHQKKNHLFKDGSWFSWQNSCKGVASRNKASPGAEGVGINEGMFVVSMYSVLRAALYELAVIAERMC